MSQTPPLGARARFGFGGRRRRVELQKGQAQEAQRQAPGEEEVLRLERPDAIRRAAFGTSQGLNIRSMGV